VLPILKLYDSNGPLPYDDKIRKYIRIESYLNVNIDGKGTKK
jgi:hypothetical protein